jgi:hypothetical protein
MCVAQTSSYQDETLAMIRKAQSMGLEVLDIQYEEDALAKEGRWIIDSVTICGPIGPFTVGCIGTREYIAKWSAKKHRSFVA